MTRHVVIGMGVAGISAALTLREQDRSAEIVLVCDDPFEYYSRPGLAYYLNDEIPEKQLKPFDNNDWKRLNAKFIRSRASRVDARNHAIEVRNSWLKYDRLLLATGAASVPLGIQGEDLKGVVKLDDFEDTRQILALAAHARTAVVVGGGVVSLEMVEGLICRGVKVHYLLRGDRYWANVLDEPESRIIENRLKHDGVILHYKTEIAEILGKHGKVTGILTKAGERLSCEIVGSCIGVRPRTELAKSAGVATDRGILANEYMQTTETDIFTAGDAAQVYDPLSRQYIVDSLWTPGRMQGRIAGLNMSGQRQLYKRKVDINVLRLAGVMLTILGSVGGGRDEDLVSVARGSSETWRQLPNSIASETGNEFNHLRLMIGERTLLGGLVLGDQKMSIPLQELVEQQIDISPVRAQLLQARAAIGQIIMDYWSGLREGGQQ